VILSSAPTFSAKVLLLGSPITFCIGADTAERLPLPKYYGGEEGAECARQLLASHGVKFLVAGRVQPNASFVDCIESLVPQSWAPMFEMISFRDDISSTEIRKRQ
jgi:hypothetical protein